DPARNETLVVIERMVRTEAAGAERRSGGVGVRGGNHDVLRRDARGLLDQAARLNAEAAVQAEQVTHDEGKLSLSVIEHQAAGVQLVVYMLRWIRSESADDP